jgi:hypothetical protein
MKKWTIRALKLLASVPLALLVGEFATRILENGFWPLLFFSDAALIVIDRVVGVICALVAWGAILWSWVLERPT